MPRFYISICDTQCGQKGSRGGEMSTRGSDWNHAAMLCKGLPDPVALVGRPVKDLGLRSRRRLPTPVEPDLRVPITRRAAR